MKNWVVQSGLVYSSFGMKVCAQNHLGGDAPDVVFFNLKERRFSLNSEKSKFKAF